MRFAFWRSIATCCLGFALAFPVRAEDLPSPSDLMLPPDESVLEYPPEEPYPLTDDTAPDGAPTAAAPDFLGASQLGETDRWIDPVYETDVLHSALPAAPLSSGHWLRSGCWYAELDFTVLHRSRARERTIGVDFFSQGRNVLNARDGNFGVEPGARLTLGYLIGRDYLNRDHSIEFTFLGLNQWNSSAGLQSIGDDGLFTPLDVDAVGFTAADTYEIAYASDLMSFELNWRMRRRLRNDRMVLAPDGTWSQQAADSHLPSLLVGLRAVTVDEQYQWLSRQDGVPFNEFGGDYFVRTNNELLGIQVGGDCIDQHGNWYWAVRGKAGAFVNFSSQRSFVVGIDGDDTPIDRSERAQLQSAAFFGELGFVGAYYITPNFALRASYDFMWIGGIAMGPNQLQFDGGPAPIINVGGSIFYQGLSTGLELHW